jgi:hypothetical protein
MPQMPGTLEVPGIWGTKKAMPVQNQHRFNILLNY